MIMYALIQFALDYCMVSRKHRRYRYIAYVLLGIDVIQYMVNPVTGHCFATEQISVEGAAYYRLIPYLGQTYHRIVDYGILGVVLILFFVKMVSSPRINSERYSVILSAMIITTVWETAYIFSRTPIDRAMIGFGVFGLLIYYLTMYYRPMRLLDSMLAHMASEIPEALFFFDANDECIWANRQGIELLGVQSDNFDYVPDRLHAISEWTSDNQSFLRPHAALRIYLADSWEHPARILWSSVPARRSAACPGPRKWYPSGLHLSLWFYYPGHEPAHR